MHALLRTIFVYYKSTYMDGFFKTKSKHVIGVMTQNNNNIDTIHRNWPLSVLKCHNCSSDQLVWSLTVSGHGAHVRPVHDALILLGQGLDVALAEVQDLLPQHSAVLMAGSLLDGEVKQHHAPDEAEADQEEAQLLGRQLPQEGRGHADWTVGGRGCCD